MELKIYNVNGTNVTEIISEEVLIHETQDALDIMADSTYQGSSKIIIHEKNIVPDFFDLKTGLAGEILQKFSTYQVQLAIVGNFDKYSSKSLRDFIYESNKYGRINFVESVTEAMAKLSR